MLIIDRRWTGEHSIAGVTRAETLSGKPVQFAHCLFQTVISLPTWQFPHKGINFLTMFYLNTATKNCTASSCQTAGLLPKLTFRPWRNIGKCTNAQSRIPKIFGERLQSNSTGTNRQPHSCPTTLMSKVDPFLSSGWRELKPIFVIMSWIGL